MEEIREGEVEYPIALWIDGEWKTVYTTRQVAENVGYNEDYISQLCNQGELIAYKVNNNWYIPPQRYKSISIQLIPF